MADFGHFFPSDWGAKPPTGGGGGAQMPPCPSPLDAATDCGECP